MPRKPLLRTTDRTPSAILLNGRSAGASELGKDAALDRLKTAFDDDTPPIEWLEPEAINDAIADHALPGRTIWLGGGDGTIRSAVSRLRLLDTPIGILPLGTMNLLANDLGIPADLGEAARALLSGTVQQIDMGEANGEAFLCSAAIGAVPELAVEREELRETYPSQLAKLAAGIKGLARSFQFGGKGYCIDLPDGSSRKIKAQTLLISNNRLMTDIQIGQPMRRASMKSGQLALYAVNPQDYPQALRLILRLLRGDWPSDPDILQLDGKAMRVTRTQRRSIPSRTILVSLDGEPIRFDLPLQLRLLPRSVPVVTPLNAPAPA